MINKFQEQKKNNKKVNVLKKGYFYIYYIIEHPSFYILL